MGAVAVGSDTSLCLLVIGVNVFKPAIAATITAATVMSKMRSCNVSYCLVQRQRSPSRRLRRVVVERLVRHIDI